MKKDATGDESVPAVAGSASDPATYSASRSSADRMIDELQRVQESLREKEAQLLVTIDEAPVGVAMVDLSKRFLKCNKTFCSFLGYSESEIVGRSIEDITFLDDVTIGIQDIRAIVAGDARTSTVQKRYVRKNGSVVWGEVHINLIRDSRGEPVHLLAIILDITDRKRAEAALASSLDLLRRTGKIAKIGGWEFDVATLRQTWTDVMFDIFEISEDRREPGVWEGVNFCAPGSKAVGETAVRRAIELGEPYDIEVEIITAKGNRRWARSIGLPNCEKGRVKSVSGIFQDITEMKITEDALRGSNRDLQSALRQLQDMQNQMVQKERLSALGQMAGGVAHDFNNALVPVLGYTELLLAGPDALEDKNEVVRMLELIRAGAMNATATVSRLREFYRPADRTTQIPVDLYRIIGETVALTRPRWKEEMAARGISIDIRMETAPVPAVLGDENELSQLLTNLIFNAVDAMPRGGSITMRLYSHVAGDSVVLEVQDTGVGMSDDVKKRCLDPFFTTKRGRGVGLGLSITHGIVRRHGGSLEIDSEPGRGTRMAVRFPIMTDKPARARTAIQTVRDGQFHVEPLRVLFADDEESARLLIAEYLRTEGHTVELAADGLEGLAMFKAGQFDLVILDRAMPGMNGDGVAVAIKALSRKTPIVMLTGFGDLMKDQGDQPVGVDVVISKPPTMDGLNRALADALEKVKGESD